MSVKISNNRLELKLNPFNEPNYFATFIDNKTIGYTSDENIIPYLNFREYINGLTLTNYGNNIIISEGSFYDNEEKKLYIFDKPITKYVLFKSDIKQTGTDTVIFEKNVAGNYTLTLEEGFYEIIAVGPGGPAAMKGINNDRGYIWTGGSGGAFSGIFKLSAGNYSITIGKIENNTTPQISNTQSSNPLDQTIYNTSISNVISVGGGHYSLADTCIGIGGQQPIFYKEPLSININQAGNDGIYGSGKNYFAKGGESVYDGYGLGQGGNTSDIANNRYWINGTSGYVKIKKINNALIENVTYNVYYDFIAKDFIYTNTTPVNRCKWIGSFKADNTHLISYYPQNDIIETFENHYVLAESLGTIGYRIYSDGWKEQWGNNANPTFPIAFKNKPLITSNGATNVTTTGMTITAGYWQAEGY